LGAGGQIPAGSEQRRGENKKQDKAEGKRGKRLWVPRGGHPSSKGKGHDCHERKKKEGSSPGKRECSKGLVPPGVHIKKLFGGKKRDGVRPRGKRQKGKKSASGGKERKKREKRRSSRQKRGLSLDGKNPMGGKGIKKSASPQEEGLPEKKRTTSQSPFLTCQRTLKKRTILGEFNWGAKYAFFWSGKEEEKGLAQDLTQARKAGVSARAQKKRGRLSVFRKGGRKRKVGVEEEKERWLPENTDEVEEGERSKEERGRRSAPFSHCAEKKKRSPICGGRFHGHKAAGCVQSPYYAQPNRQRNRGSRRRVF